MNGTLTFAQIVQQSKEFCLGLTLKQRALLAGGAVLVAATLCIFVQLIAGPTTRFFIPG